MMAWFSLDSRVWTLMVYPVQTVHTTKFTGFFFFFLTWTFILGVFEPSLGMKIIHSFLCS